MRLCHALPHVSMPLFGSGFKETNSCKKTMSAPGKPLSIFPSLTHCRITVGTCVKQRQRSKGRTMWCCRNFQDMQRLSLRMKSTVKSHRQTCPWLGRGVNSGWITMSPVQSCHLSPVTMFHGFPSISLFYISRATPALQRQHPPKRRSVSETDSSALRKPRALALSSPPSNWVLQKHPGIHFSPVIWWKTCQICQISIRNILNNIY